MNELHIYISNEIGEQTTAESVREQIAINPTAKNVIVHIASPGGSVYQGRQIAAEIAKLPGHKIAIVDSYVGSIATKIANVCDEVQIDPQARYMIHNSAVGTEGDRHELTAAVNELSRIDDELANDYAKKTGLSIDVIKSMMDKETIMSGSEAVKLGFADTLLKPLKAVAYFKTENNIMKDNEISEVKKTSNKILDILNKMLGKSEPKNMAVELEDGTSIFVQSEDGEFEGKPVFLVDAEGQVTQTPAPDGSHKLRDGRTITVENGIVTSVAETSAEEAAAPAAEMDKEKEEMKSKIAELEAKIAASAQAKAEAEAQNKTIMDQVQNLALEVKNLSSLTAGKKFEVDKGYVAPKGKDVNPEPVAKSTLDGFANYLSTIKK
jgi:ATP-dependent protease ClpP protease subunit